MRFKAIRDRALTYLSLIRRFSHHRRKRSTFCVVFLPVASPTVVARLNFERKSHRSIRRHLAEDFGCHHLPLGVFAVELSGDDREDSSRMRRRTLRQEKPHVMASVNWQSRIDEDSSEHRMVRTGESPLMKRPHAA